MNNLYILNQSFNIIGVIDDYTSIIWRPAYYDIGDFEVYLSASSKAIELLQLNRYLVRSSDVIVDSDGNTTYRKVMIIKNLELTTSVENGNFLTVTGKELKYLLHQRIVWSQTNLNGTAENAIRTLITQNAINPTDTKRKIPNLVLGATAGLTDNIEKQVTGDYLDQSIIDVCKNYNYGWEIFIFNSQMVVIVYSGIDRSRNQTVRPLVVFSDSYDNIINSSYQLATEAYANCTLIGGEGEGTERVYTTVGDSNSGLNRYETFTDARDLSQNKDTEDEITLSKYLTLLQERGAENLASLAYTEGFSGEVISNLVFKYGEDFDLGDIVTVINEYGISKDTRVLSAIESEDSTGAKLIPQFNI